MKPQKDFKHVLKAKSIVGLAELRQIHTQGLTCSPELWGAAGFSLPASVGGHLQSICLTRANPCGRAGGSHWFLSGLEFVFSQ